MRECPEEGHEDSEGSGGEAVWRADEGTWFLSAWRRYLIVVFNILMQGRRSGTNLLPLVTSDKTQGNGLKLCQERFRLSGKISSPRGWVGTGTAPQDSGHSSKPDRVQEACGQCSQAHGVIFGDDPMHCQELDLMILVCPLQLSIFYDSIATSCSESKQTKKPLITKTLPNKITH